jgi:hypothetical protein
MIQVSLTHLFLIPLTLSLSAILLWWLFYTIRDVARQPRTRATRIYRCAVCQHVYVDARDVPLSRCRRCGCLNEAVKT